MEEDGTFPKEAWMAAEALQWQADGTDLALLPTDEVEACSLHTVPKPALWCPEVCSRKLRGR